MAIEFGAVMRGPSLLLQPDTSNGGRVLMPAEGGYQQLAVRSQTGFASSNYTAVTAVATSTSATPVTLLSIPCAEGEIVGVRCLIVARQDTNASGGVHTMVAGVRRAAAGNVTSLGAASIVTIEDNAGSPVPNINANTTTQALEIQYTGVAATNLYVEAFIEIVRHSLTA